MSVNIKRLVIDALIPREISLVDLVKVLCEVGGVEEVDVIVTEVDARTETIKITIRGTNIDYDAITKTMTGHSCAIRSIDEVSVSKKAVKA